MLNYTTNDLLFIKKKSTSSLETKVCQLKEKTPGSVFLSLHESHRQQCS